MKKRKGSLLQRMMAVLLSVVLVTGMVSNAAQMTVLAQEPGGWQESVSGNAAGTVEGGIELEEKVETEPAAKIGSEDREGTASEVVEQPDGGQEQESPGEGGSGMGKVSSGDAEEETQDTVSGNDIGLPVKEANRKARMLAQSVSGEITSDTTWTDGSTVSDVGVIGGASAQDAVVITVEGSVTVTGTITVSSGYVRFTGDGSLNWQATSISNAVIVKAGANAIFENVTLDGSNVSKFGGSALLFQGTVTLGSGVKVQKFVSDTTTGSAAGNKGVIAVWGVGSLTVTDGVTVTGCSSESGIIAIYQEDTGGGESTASVVMAGGEITGNRVDNSNLGVIWNWCGKLTISGGTVTAEGNEYAVHTQGNVGKYDATTVISGGIFTGNTLGAVCAGKDSSNNSRITIAGGTFAGKTAATVNYGEINIDGGRFTGSDYALQTVNTGAVLNVVGGEFYGGTKAYSGNVATRTDKVIVGTGKESAANWDKKTDLNTYQYVAIGEIPEHPGDNWKRDVNFKIKIYGYREGYPLNFENVGVIWEGNINNPVMGEVLAKEEVRDGYYLWEYVFKGLDTGRKYGIKNGNTPGQIGEISETGTAFEKTVYAVNYYDGDTLAQVMYTESGKTAGRAWQPPAKDGYIFAGWMTEKGGSETFDFEETQITQVTDVYASWTLNAPPHEHDDISFTAWTATDSLPTAEGNYYLTGNVTLSDTWSVPSGETILCLNGNTITQTTTDRWTISIGSGSTCKLYDCKDGGKITGKQGVSVSGGTFDMHGGIISDIICGRAAVYVHDQGTFHMNGGRISDNINNSTAGVSTAVVNYALGGGVNVNNGTFNMSGGEILRNVRYGGYGGGVCVYAGVFYMSGGKISGNNNGVQVWANAAFHMSGGEVSENMGTYCGGVHIMGTMTAGGNIVITGNTGGNGEEKNLFIQSGVIQINTSNLLANSVNIGVTTVTAPTDVRPVNITGENGADYSGHFHSDNVDYEIVNGTNNVVQLAVKASPDTQPPTGKIEVEDNSWTSFLNAITFELFFKEEKSVTITAEDTGSGVDKIYYYLSGVELTETQVEALGADVWQEGNSFPIVPDSKGVIYAKITDKAGNVTCLSSDGLVFDATPPVISGATNGETYLAPQTVTVTDTMSGVKSVTVNGTEVALTDNQFTLGTADNPQTIVVTDRAGNTTTVTVTVKVESHTHNLTLTPAKSATCTEDGNTAYYTCEGCDKWYSDAAGEQEIADKDSVVISKTGHSYDNSEWGYKEANGHAHNCQNCDAHDAVRSHTPGAAATEETPQTCTVCGYIIAPATGTEPGTVTLEVKPGENAPVTNISTPTEELEKMLLTDEEKRQVQSGTDIRIVLEVKDAGSAVSDPDKENIKQALNGYAVGQYLNIDLYKLIGETRTDITETAKKIRIVITVPDSLKNADSSKTRTFAVIRVHDGRAELLADLDSSADTITIETDRFSTYAIAYKDTTNSGNGGGNSGNDDNHGNDDDNNGGGNGSGNDNGGNGGGSDNGNDNSSSNNNSQNNSDKNDTKPDSTKDSEPKTGDATPLELYATLAMIAGFAYLLLYFTDRRRGMTEETKKELVSRLVGWAKRGGRIRKCLAIAAVFVLLVYYHSIGKKTCAEWKEIYGE